MSEIKLFNLKSGNAMEIAGEADGLEKSLQKVFENNLETLLGVRFIATEHSTGKVHGGRIDSLGIDENNCPVIMEYKRAISENVINQGLFYLDWLMDHKGEFTLLVRDRYSKDVADLIDWSAPRLVCVASDFTKFDDHAIRQINRNIDLIRYRRFGSELLALELASQVSAKTIQPIAPAKKPGRSNTASRDRSFAVALAELDKEVRELYEDVRSYILSLGDDVTEKQLKLYIAFRRIKSFVTIVPLPTKKQLIVYLTLDPTSITIEEGFSRDMREISHWGTGNLELTVTDKESLSKTLPLIQRSYEGM